MEAEVTPWWEDHVGGTNCHAMACLRRAQFYRYVTINGWEYRQLACTTHAGKEAEFCSYCGQFLDGRETCPKCHRGKEEHVNAD